MSKELEGHIRLVANIGSELVYAYVPEDGQQHMVTIMIQKEGLDIYVDGTPVDPETGLNPTDSILEAADEMAAWFSKSGWKFNTDNKKVQKFIDKYINLRKKLEPPEPAPPVSEPIAIPLVPIPPVESKPGWNDFISRMQKTYNRGEIVPCSCGTPITTFDDLKIHWNEGHFDGQEMPAKTPAHALMPQREGPVSS